VPGRDYAVDLWQGPTALGAGFLIAPCYLLTADHCLRALATDDDLIRAVFADGHTVDGRICQRVAAADLALVQVLQPELVPPTVPFPDLPVPGDPWNGLYQPSYTDPQLSGQVNHASVPYDTEGGGRIEAVQLQTEQLLGDYSGYSGSPVERTTPGKELAVLGILVEQYPDRANPDRYANVLFAATIREAITRFAQFRTGHLLRVLEAREEGILARGPVAAGARPTVAATVGSSPSPRTAVSSPAATLTEVTGAAGAAPGVDGAVATGHSLLAAIKEWSAQGLIDPSNVSELQVHVAKSVIEVALRGGTA
jgi:hypothetical protein